MARAPHPSRTGASSQAGAADRLAALLPLAYGIAGAIHARVPPSVDRDDLRAAAAFGAWQALCRQPDLDGEAFRSYAVQRIRGAVLDELRAQDWLPRRMRTAGSDVTTVRFDDLAPADVTAALKTPPTQEHDTDAARAAKRLLAAMASLTDRQRRILTEFHLEERKQADVASDLGISEPRVSQLRKIALRKLRVRLLPLKPNP